jgi:hypothetical protein
MAFLIMSISNFSQKRSPTEDFLQSLERELNLQAINILKSFQGLSVPDLADAKLRLAFDLEEMRTKRIRQFCESEEYRNYYVADPPNPLVACLSKKWQNTTVFDKKVVFKRPSNPDIASKRKSEMVHAAFNFKPDPRKSLHIPREGQFRKSFFDSVDVKKMKCSRVVGLGLSLTGTKKSRDYSAIQNEYESAESKPNLFGADGSSDDDFANSVQSGSTESEEECVTEETGDFPTNLPVLSIVKQNRLIVDLHGGKIKNVVNPFSKPTMSYSLLSSESHRLSLFDADSLVSWVFYGGRAVKTSRVANSNQILAKIGLIEAEGAEKNPHNGVLIRNSESFFKDENFGSGHRYNSVQGTADKVCYNSHNFQNSVRVFSSLSSDSRPSRKENRVSLSFGKEASFTVSVEEGHYGAFVNLGLEAFTQKLLLEPGMVLLTNEKKGLGVHTLISPTERSRKIDLIRTAMTCERTYFHCANLKLATLGQFMEMLKQRMAKAAASAVNWSQNSGANTALKQFFLPLLSANSSPIVVLTKVEFHQQYKLFQWKEKAIVFQVDLTDTEFEPYFEKPEPNSLDFLVGETLFKSQGETKFRNPITSFLAPYDLLFSFCPEVERFCMSYPRQHPSEFCNLYDPFNCCLAWQDKPGSAPLTQEEVIAKEGIWVSLTKTDFLEETLSTKEPVHLPYGSLLLVNQIVYLVSQISAQIKVTPDF